MNDGKIWKRDWVDKKAVEKGSQEAERRWGTSKKTGEEKERAGRRRSSGKKQPGQGEVGFGRSRKRRTNLRKAEGSFTRQEKKAGGLRLSFVEEAKKKRKSQTNLSDKGSPSQGGFLKSQTRKTMNKKKGKDSTSKRHKNKALRGTASRAKWRKRGGKISTE